MITMKNATRRCVCVGGGGVSVAILNDKAMGSWIKTIGTSLNITISYYETLMFIQLSNKTDDIQYLIDIHTMKPHNTTYIFMSYTIDLP